MIRDGAPFLFGAFLLLSFARLWLNRPGRRPGLGGYLLGAALTYVVAFLLALGGVTEIVAAVSGETDARFWAEAALLAPACWLIWRGLRRLFPWPLALETQG